MDKKGKKALPANYGKATPRQVAEVVLKHQTKSADSKPDKAAKPC